MKPLSTNLGPVHAYPDVIENGDFLFYFHAFYKIRDSNCFSPFVGFTLLSRILQTSLVFISGYANTGKTFSTAFIN